MKLTRLFAKNFLSIGDQGIEYVFDFNDILLVYGKNGEGKSTCLDVLVFNLYDKNFRGVNKSQLPNIHNPKNCYTESTIEDGSDTYVIKRGIAPNIFEVWKNGVEVPQQSSVKLMQEWLETNILKDSYATFKQKYILASADYTPFMKLDAAGRRAFSEEVLNLTVFTKMNKVLKNKLSLVTTDHATSSSLLHEVVRSIASLVGVFEESIKEKNKELEAAITSGQEIVDRIKVLETEMSKLTFKDYTSWVNEHRTYATEKAVAEAEVKRLVGQSEFFQHLTKCTTCGQEVNEAHIKSMVADIATQRTSREATIKDLEHKMLMTADLINAEKVIEGQINDYKIKINTELQKRDSIKQRCVALMADIESLKKKAESADGVDNLKKRRLELEGSVAALSEEKEVLTYAAKMLKDDGIKATVMKQFIPILNQNINKYLQIFDFFVKFEFDENFTETISGGAIKQYSYNSFSMGERQRIDLAMHLAWKDISQTQSVGDLGILFFDEILDSSLDVDGADALLEILKNRLKGIRSVIISHKDAFKDKIDNHIHIEKENGFTRLKVV